MRQQRTSWPGTRGVGVPTLGGGLPSRAGVHPARHRGRVASALLSSVSAVLSRVLREQLDLPDLRSERTAAHRGHRSGVRAAEHPGAAEPATARSSSRSSATAAVAGSRSIDVAAQMVAYRQRFDFKFVLMAGDNIYEGPATAEDYRVKFEEPYKLLLDAGVKFYAVLGNHDDPQQVNYKPFNMNGNRYYTFTPPVDPITRWDTRVRFFALDSTNLDGAQMAWFEQRVDAVARRVENRASSTTRSTRLAATPCRRAATASRSSRRSSPAASTSCSRATNTSTQRSELQKGVLYFISGARRLAARRASRRRRALIAQSLRRRLSLHAGRDCRRRAFSSRRSTARARRSTRARCATATADTTDRH